MQITVNGRTTDCVDGATVLDLIRQLDLSPDKLVVERNQDILPAEQFGMVVLNEGDTLDLLQFVGGG